MSRPVKPLFALALLIAASTAMIGWAEPQVAEKPGEQATAPTDDTIVLTNARGTLIMKGLYGKRSPSGHGTGAVTMASAVIQGLRWLQHTQNKDGSWGSGGEELDTASGLALVAFMGHGETPASAEFGMTVEKGLKFLISDMLATNGLPREEQPPAIRNAIATWAVCEAYAMTRILALKPAAEAGLAVILKGQRNSGLWDTSYRTGEGEDNIEASVWQVLALKSGRMMGCQMDGLSESLQKVSAAMESVLGTKPEAGIAAGAVLCLQLCGQSRKPICRTALDDMDTMIPDWDKPLFKDPIFRWHLATQAFYQAGGQHWMRWNRPFFPMLCQHQVVEQDNQGRAVGYWDTPGGGERFGRVSVTALSLLMLEVGLQRHLPTYHPELSPQEETVPDKDVEIRF